MYYNACGQPPWRSPPPCLFVPCALTHRWLMYVHNISNSWAVTRWTILATSTLTTSPEAVAVQVPPEISYTLSCPSLQSLGSVPSTVLHWEAPIKPSLLPQLLPLCLATIYAHFANCSVGGVFYHFLLPCVIEWRANRTIAQSQLAWQRSSPSSRAHHQGLG